MSNSILRGARKELLVHARGNILEIGFGTGLNLPEYPSHVHQLTAIDIDSSLDLLKDRRIKDSAIKVKFYMGCAENLPFAVGTFDTVVSTWTFCSVQNVQQALDEIFRVLKPGGKVLFIEHVLNKKKVIRFQQRLWSPVWRRVAGGCNLDRDLKSVIDERGQFDFLVYKKRSFKGVMPLVRFMIEGVMQKKTENR